VRAETPRSIVRDAALVCLASLGLAAGVNALSPEPLPWVAEREYQVLVPCPEVTGEAAALAPTDPALADLLAPGNAEGRTLLLDARDAAAYAAWHVPGAWSVPYDYLAPTSADMVSRVLGSGAARIVVVGDGDDPDSGRELARELAGKGLKNVAYVTGGAPALRSAAGGGRP
jgi:hypothetical protein